jgi:VanZ like family
MQNRPLGHSPNFLGSAWANRNLVLAIAGILFLTLYPFRFDLHAVVPGDTSPFLLGGVFKGSGLKSALLNILLFVPFGFGLSEKLRERGKARSSTLVMVLAAGALLSYGIEFLQIYIPDRDSGWEDVFTNTLGSVAGFGFYELLGKLVLHCLASCETLLVALLRHRRVFVVLLVYFGLWFAISSLLQRKTRLSNWRADVQLVVGNDGSGKYPWKGRVDAAQIWDHAVGGDAGKRLSAGQVADTGDTGLLVDDEFSAGMTLNGRRQISSELVWLPRTPATSSAGTVALDGGSWLATKGTVPELVAQLQKTNQFTVRVVCTPAEVVGSEGKILSISQASGISNLTLRQENADLVFSFRNPLSASNAILGWNFPGVFADGGSRDIVYSYDGSNLSLFIDGVQEPLTYSLGPGTALAKFIRLIRPAELEGYNYIYYIMVFCPAGAILGLAARNLAPSKFSAKLWLAIGLLIPAVLLECVLASTSGRPVSFDYMGLSALLAIGGFLWTKCDRV